MRLNYLYVSLLLLHGSLLYAQTDKNEKAAALSYNVSLSDYSLPLKVKNTSFSEAFQTAEWYQPGMKSFGIGVSYWKGLLKWMDFSSSLSGTFSNFPENYLKNDNIGQAKFTPQLDLLLHLKMFSNKARVNPFCTVGAGVGYFSQQMAVYTPTGLGLRLKFTDNTFAVLQGQWRFKLTEGINNDYLFYNIGIAQSISKRKVKGLKSVNPVTDPTKPIEKEKTITTGPVGKLPNQNVQEEVPPKKESTAAIINNDSGGGGTRPDSKDQLSVVSIKNLNEQVTEAAEHITFGFASSTVQKDAQKWLNEVIDILRRYPMLKLSIAAHSDNRGTKDRNQYWSDQRARSLADYFLSRGIPADRITYQGYGDTQPLADNRTEAGRAQNRRVELKLSNGNNPILHENGLHLKTGKEIKTPVESPEIAVMLNEKVKEAAKHITFGFASSTVQKDAQKWLNEVIDILRRYPILKLSIAAHSDNRGTKDRNQYWSDQRARSLADYFLSRGIPADRITYQGYGDTQPLADNHTEAGRAQNRRVELKLENWP